ncbi:MAG: glycosyltransferase family 39 protein [Anaerolineae bacterium]|nr:glycosyltransferase family 39 protein [Anaerolineae bacterium]
MTERKPVEIPDDDWTRTPPAVRAFVGQAASQIEQLEAQLQTLHPDSQAASLATAAAAASQASAVEVPQLRLRPRRTLNRVALLGLAVVLAGAGQYLLIHNSLWDGLLFYLLAALLLGRGLRDASISASDNLGASLAKPLQIQQGIIQTLGLVVLGGALLLALIAYYAFGQKELLPHAWNFYLYSLAALVIGVLLLTRTGETQPFWPRSPVLQWVLALIFALALFMRLWQIDSLPFGIWYDEAISGLQGVRWNTEAAYRPQFEENNAGQLIFLFATAVRWFGQHATAIRLVSVALGLAGVGAAYLFGNELGGPRFGLVLAFFVAVARWHVSFSRIAMPGIDTPLAEFLALFFLLRLWRYGRLRDAAWAGISLGLGLSLYSAFRLFLLALGVFALLAGLIWWRSWWPRRKESQWWRQWGVRLALLSLALGLTALPVIHFALHNPADFWARVQKTSIINRRDEPDLGKALWRTTYQHVLMFNFHGDRNGRHNLPGEPMLDPATGILFVLGFSLALARLKQPTPLFFFILFLTGLLGGILSLDFEAPQSLRSIAALPAVFYFCALALETVGRQIAADLRPWPVSWLAVPGVALGSFIFYYNAHTYFERQAHDFGSWNAFSTAESIAGKRMAQLGPDYTFYLSPFFNEHPAIRFLSPATPDRRQLILPDALPIRQPADRPAALFIHPDDKWIYDSARSLYPSARFEVISDEQTNTPVVYTAELTREDLAQLQGLELRYWPNQSWDGPPQTSLTVKMIDQFWPDAASLALSSGSLEGGGFVAEWSGALYAPDYGSYVFTLRAPAAASLEIDGNVVVKLENEGQQIAPLLLAQGNHRLRVRALGGIGPVSLLWQRPGHQTEVVPPWAFYRPPVTNHGLQGNYYTNANWEGAPALARIDPFLDIYFHITPLPRPYTAEWSGVLAAPQGGAYTLGLRAVDWAQLYVDDQLAVETTGPDALTQATLILEQGLHDVRLRFKDATGRSRLHLLWQPPGQAAMVAIPAHYLWPSRSSYVEPSPAELPPPEALAAPQAIPLPLPASPSTGQMRIIAADLGEILLSQPRGIAVGPNGRVYVTDTGNQRLLVLDEEGRLVSEVKGGAAPFAELSDVATDHRGQVYVLDVGREHLSIFDAEGNYLREVPAQPDHIGYSRGLFVDHQNYLWLANTSANRVVALDLAGNVLVEFPVAPDVAAQPVDVVTAPDGNIYVTDIILDRLLCFGVDGQLRQSWSIPHSTSLDGAHLAVDEPGNLYLTLPEESQVLQLGPTGEAIASWNLHQPDGQKMKPVGIAVDAEGQVWVVDSAGGNLVVLTGPGSSEDSPKPDQNQ